MSEEQHVEIGALDPVRAFDQTLHDLYQIVEIFQADDTAMTPKDFLNATRAAHERLKAITTMTMIGLTTAVADKIPADVQAQHQAEIELEELMSTPEDKQRRMLKALREITFWTTRNDT